MEKIKHALTEFLQKSGFEDKLEEMDYLKLWSQAVGPQIIKNASPVSLKENKLWVEVSDNVWVYHLTMLKPKLIKEFNKAAGFSAIEDIKFMNVDFSSSRRKFEYNGGIKAKRNDSVPNLNISVDLCQEEKEILKKVTQNSPPQYKAQLLKLLRGSLTRQKRRRKSGAVDCYLCGFPYFKKEMKGELCLLCLQKYERWRKILRPHFYRTPWLKFDQLQALYPSLELIVYDICQEKVKQQYYKRVQKILIHSSLTKEFKKKIILRIMQRFVMLSEKKDPTQLNEEDIIKSLHYFPEYRRIEEICFSKTE